jgi:hypothetical protein
MNRPLLWLLVMLLGAPAAGYLLFRLARGLGFLDPPVDRQHEMRRTILVSLYCFLLLLPVGIYGFEKGWPRAWVLFGVVVSLALVFFSAGGIWAALRLWRLRHPELAKPESPNIEKDLGSAEEDAVVGRKS